MVAYFRGGPISIRANPVSSKCLEQNKPLCFTLLTRCYFCWDCLVKGYRLFLQGSSLMVTSDTPKPPQSVRLLAPALSGHMIANMEKQQLPQVPVLVRVSAQRALGIMAEDQSWEDFAWSVSIPTDVRVLDEWAQDNCRFVTIDWSGE